jgi:hypothetical protein
MQDALIADVFAANGARVSSAEVFFHFEIGQGVDDIVYYSLRSL